MMRGRPSSRGPIGPGGHMGMGVAVKARDFKGTMKKLIGYLKKYRMAIVVVFIFAVASTAANIAGPKILGQATTTLFEGVMAHLANSGEIDFLRIQQLMLLALGLYLGSAIFAYIQADITPLNTHSDWAWIPPIAWGADGKILYYTTHAPPPSLVNAEDSPYFDIGAASFENNSSVEIVEQTGMFAYPSVSRLQASSRERPYQVAYLQAILPEQSETSRYRVVVMDRDGSNRRTIFPPQDAPGLEPQTPVWAPEAIEGQNGDFIAVVYQGNLWLLDSGSGEPYQVTGDGLVTRIDWK